MANSPASPQPALLELRNVTVVRNGRAVLHGVDLCVESGEHVAILGPNGSGKSTLIKLLTRELYPCYDGRSSMRVLGKETWGQESWRVTDLRGMLGIVSNEIDAFVQRGVPCYDAVISGFFSSVGLGQHHQLTDAMHDKATELLAWLGIEHLSERPLGEMSSGEARRVMIARALVHSPRALLFDEPSNSLDVYAQIELRRTMSKLAQGGIALLLVTHHLPDIVPEIDRVILLRGGRIAGDGPKGDMLTTERLSDLFGCPVRITVEDGHYHLVS
jgi:iron complex transport system ATP-binding protein